MRKDTLKLYVCISFAILFVHRQVLDSRSLKTRLGLPRLARRVTKDVLIILTMTLAQRMYEISDALRILHGLLSKGHIDQPR